LNKIARNVNFQSEKSRLLNQRCVLLYFKKKVDAQKVVNAHSATPSNKKC